MDELAKINEKNSPKIVVNLRCDYFAIAIFLISCDAIFCDCDFLKFLRCDFFAIAIFSNSCDAIIFAIAIFPNSCDAIGSPGFGRVNIKNFKELRHFACFQTITFAKNL